ncbi:MAG: ATP-binding protein [Fusobacteriales bacterium]|jgi:molecular chaperone HtpG|nr:ATP-binding protein [Fusobacteriales bacterium]
MNSIKIGKNAIENLTRGMYHDSQIIYREYIQNAVDQKIEGEELIIDISIDKNARKIVIKDNATGVKVDKVKSTLADVADSDKQRGESAGFRGIGRLGGLAYCGKLKFITTARGERKKTIMSWDAKYLSDMLDDNSVKEDAGTILQKIISYDYEDCPVEEHYFIVELEDVKEENFDLLDVEKVRRYIAINTPVPFSGKFYYKKKIYDYLKEKEIDKNEYKIYVNSEDIHKLYTTVLYEKGGNHPTKKYDEIYDIEIKEFYTETGEFLAWMWYGISRFEKQIPFPLNEIAGIRLRQFNIQIGDERTLVPFFKEVRGNLYYVGEVHVMHNGLIPNARRDYFNENKIRNEFEAELKYFFFSTLHNLYINANRIKNNYKKEVDLIRKKEEYEKKKNNSIFVSDNEIKKDKEKVEKAKLENDKAKKELERIKKKADENQILDIVYKHIEDKHNETLKEVGFETSELLEKEIIDDKDLKENSNSSYKKKKKYLANELSHLPKEQQKLISHIYDIIKQNLPDKQSEELVAKIQEELKYGKKSSVG